MTTPSTSNTHDLLDIASDAVRAATVVCRFVQDRLATHAAMTKTDASPVTIADYASQAIIAAILKESLGDFVLVAEESAAALRAPDHAAQRSAIVAALTASGVWPEAREDEVLDAIDLGTGDPLGSDAVQNGFWTLDPIDGTKGFLRNQQYCISLAYIHRGRPIIGILGCPNLSENPASSYDSKSPRGTLFTAIAGNGAHMLFDAGEATMEVLLERTDVEPGEPARSAESFEAAHSSHDLSARAMALAGPVAPSIRIDSQCKYAIVARGDADVYLRLPSRKGYIERIWDHAAGALIAEESGCTVTDIHGTPLDFSLGRGLENTRGIVGAPPKLHARLIQALGQLAKPTE